MNVDAIDKKCPVLYNVPNCCHGNIHSFTSIVWILDRDIRVWHTHMCATFEQNRTRIDNFGKFDLDLTNFDLQRLEKSHCIKVECDQPM